MLPILFSQDIRTGLKKFLFDGIDSVDNVPDKSMERFIIDQKGRFSGSAVPACLLFHARLV